MEAPPLLVLYWRPFLFVRVRRSLRLNAGRWGVGAAGGLQNYKLQNSVAPGPLCISILSIFYYFNYYIYYIICLQIKKRRNSRALLVAASTLFAGYFFTSDELIMGIYFSAMVVLLVLFYYKYFLWKQKLNLTWGQNCWHADASVSCCCKFFAGTSMCTHCSTTC